jgi:putative DNA methylase
LVPLQPGYEKVQRTFSRQALAMVWDYVEVNPMSETVGGWNALFTDVIDTLSHLTQIPPVEVED